jgi:CheY-like chemotaxis protein
VSNESRLAPLILVVEDDANQRLYYEEELEEAGYRVVTAGSGPEALEIVRQGGVDLVVLDIGMPGMDGIETLARILDINRELPIVLNTAYSNYRDDFMTWAADAYVTKSSNPTKLLEAIREALVKRGIPAPEQTDETAE